MRGMDLGGSDDVRDGRALMGSVELLLLLLGLSCEGLFVRVCVECSFGVCEVCEYGCCPAGCLS